MTRARGLSAEEARALAQAVDEVRAQRIAGLLERSRQQRRRTLWQLLNQAARAAEAVAEYRGLAAQLRDMRTQVERDIAAGPEVAGD